MVNRVLMCLGLLVVHIFIVEVQNPDSHVVRALRGAVGIQLDSPQIAVEGEPDFPCFVIGFPQQVPRLVRAGVRLDVGVQSLDRFACFSVRNQSLYFFHHDEFI